MPLFFCEFKYYNCVNSHFFVAERYNMLYTYYCYFILP